MTIPNMAATAAQKLLKVAIVGLPNAGKSTLVNNIMAMTVCPVSSRVHTTRLNQQTAYLQDNTQVVFIDTPGLVNMKEIKKFAFSKDFIFGPENSVKAADVVAVIHDLSFARTRDKLDPRIKGLLEKFPDKNSILILNKVDLVKSKRVLLDAVRILTSGVVSGRPLQLKKTHLERVYEEKKRLEMDNVLRRAKRRVELGDSAYEVDLDQHTKEMVLSSFTEDEIQEKKHLLGWPKFQDIFMISALTGDGVDLVKDYFVMNAKATPWKFEEDFLTDVDPRELAIRVVKSALLDYLPQEIPYKVTPMIDYWGENEAGVLRVIVCIKCPNERYAKRVCGTGGVTLKQITEYCEKSITSMMRAPVDLCINPVIEKKKAS